MSLKQQIYRRNYRFRWMLLIVFGMAICSSNAQISVHEELKSRPEPFSYTVEKARLFLFDLLMEEDYTRISEVIVYLDSIESVSNQLSLYPVEKWFLSYFAQDYGQLLEHIVFIEESQDYLTSKIAPREDFLFSFLCQKAQQDEGQLLAYIQASELSEQHKVFLKLKLKYLLNLNFPMADKSKELSEEAKLFVRAYKDDFQTRYVTKYMIITTDAEDKKLKLGFNFLTGTDFYSSDLSRRYSPAGQIGVNFELYYSRFVFTFINEIGIQVTRIDMTSGTELWPQGSSSRTYRMGLSAGYLLRESSAYSWIIGAGIAGFSIDPTENNLNRNPAWEVFQTGYRAKPFTSISFDYRPYHDFVGFHTFKDPNLYLRFRYSVGVVSFPSIGLGETNVVHSFTIHLGAAYESTRPRKR